MPSAAPSRSPRQSGGLHWGVVCSGRKSTFVLLQGLLLAAAGGCIPSSDPPPGPPGSTPGDLASLVVSAGALSPAFDPAVTSYALLVPNATTSTTVTATAAERLAKISINNQAATPGQPFGPIPLAVGQTTVTVVVDGPGFNKTYTIVVTRSAAAIADLASLQVSAGGLSPRFDPQVLAYSVLAANSTTSTTITVTTADTTATLAINNLPARSGETFGPIPLNLGPNAVTIVVTAPGGAVKTYSVAIVRGASGIADLAALSLSAGALSPGFTPDQTSYRIATGNSTTQTTITAVVADATASLTVNGTPATSGQPFGPIGLTIGVNILTVRVTAQDGTAKVYTIEITRPPSSNANLSALALSAGSFSPAFSEDQLDYSLSVPSTTASTTVTATVADETASVQVNGQPVGSGQASPPIALNVGTNQILIVVTAQNGTTKTYTVTVERTVSTDLAGLIVSAGPLSPGFSAGTTTYSLEVLNTTTSTTVTATVQDPTATLTINGAAANSGQAFGPIALNVGPNQVTIIVRALNGATKTYTVTITRAANVNLASLSLSAGSPTPPFSPSVTSYTLSVPNETTSTTVTATVEDATSTLTINGQSVPSGQAFGPVALAVGQNSVTILVRAVDGVTTKTYSVTITRAPSSNALLAGLQVTPGFMLPVFSPSVTTYTVNGAGLFTAAANVTATVQEPNASITINGAAVASGTTLQVPLTGPSTPITVLVRAQDQVTTVTYNVTVNR